MGSDISIVSVTFMATMVLLHANKRDAGQLGILSIFDIVKCPSLVLVKPRKNLPA